MGVDVEPYVALLAHPLNRAVFDDDTGRVTAGYTIVQPRIETSPSSSRQTRFSRIFATRGLAPPRGRARRKDRSRALAPKEAT